MFTGRISSKGNIEAHDGLEHQGVYVYKPAGSAKVNGQQRPKRRKLTHEAEESSQEEELPFLSLLNGVETRSLVKHRYAAFQDFWSGQNQRIQNILGEVDSKAVDNLTEFVRQAVSEIYECQIPCGMITLGSNISSVTGLLDRLRKRVQSDGIAQVAVLESGDAANLKNVLKFIIRTILADTEGENVDDDSTPDRLGPKLLPYDLENLHGYVQRNPDQKIVIAFKDSEAFDYGVLGELVSLLWSWRDRIPFVFLFGIATSVELFEARLPRSIVGLLQGKCFDIGDSGDSVDRVFFNLQTHPEGTLWLGHNVSKLLVERPADHFQSPERLAVSFKYTYMAHFFANQMAALVSKEVCEKDFQPELCEAIRNMPSFHQHCQTLLEAGDSKTVKRLLDDDQFLTQEALKYVYTGQEKMNRMFRSVETLKAAIEYVKGAKTSGLSSIVIRALAGELFGSKIITDMLSAINRMTSDALEGLLPILTRTLPGVEELSHQLRALLASRKGEEPLRSRYDDSRVTHKTTVVSQRLKLTKTKAKLSKEELEYTKIVDSLHAAFQDYLRDSLIHPTDLFMHEAFLFDYKGPIRDTFTPRPRTTVERALSSPSDYLAFDSEATFETLSDSQPATALVYQLYLESGTLVNIYDLWRAFYAIIGGEDGERYNERAALTMFYRAVSELKMMGMVKPSRRKTDHLAKLSWMGL